MNDEDFTYHLVNLKEQDPDYIVDVLELTAEDLIAAFPRKVAEFLEYDNG